MGVLLIMGCFGICFFAIEEGGFTGGKRLPKAESVFKNLRISTDLTPGEPTLTIEKGWLERKRMGLFVMGGLQRLVLDRVTLTLPKDSAVENTQRVVDLLPQEVVNHAFIMVELKRLEFRRCKDEGGEAFLRVALAEVSMEKAQPIILENAWFRDTDGQRWEQLRSAWIERGDASQVPVARLQRKNGEYLSMPLQLGF